MRGIYDEARHGRESTAAPANPMDWSTSPNINPHTGQQGTREPKMYDVNPSYQQPYGSQGGFGNSSGWPPRRR